MKIGKNAFQSPLYPGVFESKLRCPAPWAAGGVKSWLCCSETSASSAAVLQAEGAEGELGSGLRARSLASPSPTLQHAAAAG